MKKLTIFICGILFFCSSLAYGQVGYKNFIVDSISSNYYVKWKDYARESSKAEMIYNYSEEMKQLFLPLVDSIQRLISESIPDHVPEIVSIGVGIVYTKSGEIVRMSYMINKEALYLFSETLLLNISHLLLKLHIDYPILESIEKRWRRESPERRKRRTGYTMIYFDLYDTEFGI